MKYQILFLLSAIICIPNQSQAQLFKNKKNKKNKKKTEQTQDIDKKENNSNYVYFEGFTGYRTEYSEDRAVDCDTFDATDLTYESSPEFEDNDRFEYDQDLDFEDVITTSYESPEAQPELATAFDSDTFDATDLTYESSPEFDTNVQDVDFEDVIALHNQPSEVQPERGSAFKRFSNAIHSKVFAPKPKTDGFSIAAISCGLLGLLVFGYGVLGITFGIIGLNRTKKRGTRGKGMAITGLVAGIVKVIIVLALLLL